MPYNNQTSIRGLVTSMRELQEIGRQRTIDMNAARRNLAIQQLQQTVGAQVLSNLSQNPAGPRSTGLLQKSLESSPSPEMQSAYTERAKNAGIQERQQGLQDYLTSPTNQPPQPKKGIGGVLHSIFVPPVQTDFSQAQKGLLGTALAGQPVPLGEVYEHPLGQRKSTAMLDLRTPEQRSQAELTQAHASNWRASGGGAGGSFVVNDAGEFIRPYTRGESLGQGEKVIRAGTERQENLAQEGRSLAEELAIISGRYRLIQDPKERQQALEADSDYKDVKTLYDANRKQRMGRYSLNNQAGESGQRQQETAEQMSQSTSGAYPAAGTTYAAQEGERPSPATPRTMPPRQPEQPQSAPENPPVAFQPIRPKLAVVGQRTATNPRTGEKLVWDGEQWVRMNPAPEARR